MSDVGGIVHGRSAHVPSNVAILHRDEGLFLAREGVPQEELAGRDGVRSVDFGGVPRVTVRVGAAAAADGAADGLAKVACSGERHIVGLIMIAREVEAEVDEALLCTPLGAQ